MGYDTRLPFSFHVSLVNKHQLLQRAEAQLAYELQAAKIRQKIRNEEIQIEVVERRKQIEVEEQEVQRKERELNATVRLPAEAESYRVQMIAEGKRYVLTLVCRCFICKLWV
jgi:flotillin